MADISALEMRPHPMHPHAARLWQWDTLHQIKAICA